MLLKEAGIAEQDHQARRAEGEKIAREHLKAHKTKAIALAEPLLKNAKPLSPRS